MNGAAGNLNGSANYALPVVYRANAQPGNDKCRCFMMPLHYPRYKKFDYETMPEWQLNCLLSEYGLPVIGDLPHKRKFAMGAFLWPSETE